MDKNQKTPAFKAFHFILKNLELIDEMISGDISSKVKHAYLEIECDECKVFFEIQKQFTKIINYLNNTKEQFRLPKKEGGKKEEIKDNPQPKEEIKDNPQPKEEEIKDNPQPKEEEIKDNPQPKEQRLPLQHQKTKRLIPCKTFTSNRGSSSLTKHHTSEITSLIALSDERIVTGAEDGSLIISSINYNEESFIKEIEIKSAHSNKIIALTELNNSLLISGCLFIPNTLQSFSEIKIWQIQQSSLTLQKQINISQNIITKIIPLMNINFLVCADEQVMVFNTIDFTKVAEFSERNKINSAIKLNNKDILVTCTDSLGFWTLTSYSKVFNMRNIQTTSPNGLIELSNENIAISSCKRDFPILIVDPLRYAIIKQIVLKQNIKKDSTLMVLNNDTFVYVNNGCYLEFNTSEYELIFQYMSSKRIRNNFCFVRDNEYLVVQRDSKGIQVIKLSDIKPS